MPNLSSLEIAFRSWLRGGGPALSREQRAIMQDHLAAASPEIRASTSTTGSSGAYLIPQEHTAAINEALARFSAVADVSEIISTATGATLPYPSVNDTANSAAITADNTAGDETHDPTFGQIMLGAYSFSAGVVVVPVGLLEDSEVDIEGLLYRLLMKRAGRKMNPVMTTGTGSSQPTGILTAATLGVTAASQTDIAYSELIDLEHSVDAEYRANGSYMLNDATLKVVRKLVDAGGYPIFKSDTAGPDGGRRPTINGFPVAINNDMPTLGAGNKTILFGDMSNYKIRRVKEVILLRMTERYMDRRCIGFSALIRADGNLSDAGTNPVKYLQQAAA